MQSIKYLGPKSQKTIFIERQIVFARQKSKYLAYLFIIAIVHIHKVHNKHFFDRNY